MAVPVIVSATVTKLSANATVFVPAMPSTRPDGDLYIFIGGKDDDPAWTNIPANWTSLQSGDAGNAGPFAQAFYWYGDSEPSAYTLTQDSEEAACVIFHITGAATSGNPTDVSNLDTGNSANSNSLSVTTTVNDCLVLISKWVDGDPVTATPSTTQASGGSSNDSSADANQVGIGVWSTTQASFGATPTTAFTHGTDTWVGITLAIAPPATGNQDLSPTGLPSAESFGSHQVDMNVQSLTGIVTAESIGSPQIDMNVQSLTGIATAESFGAAQLDLNVQSLTGIVSAESLGAVVVTVGTVDISPASIVSTESFGIVGVHCEPLSNPISSFAISSHDCSSIQGIGPAGGIASAESFGTATVVIVQDVLPSSIGSAESFGTAVITTGAVDVSPTGIASLESFGTALITIDISPTGIASAESVPSPLITIDIAPTGIASAESFGTAVLTLDIVPTGITSAEAFGTALITLDITPTGISSAESVPSPTLTSVADISPTGIPSSESLGAAVITTGTVDISPASITSAESIGSHIVTLGDGDQPVIAIAIPSAESFGSATITTGVVDISPTGISSAESLGTPSITLDISPTGIPSAEVVPSPTLGIGIGPTGITSAESFGTSVFGIGLGPTGISSAESFGTALITLDISPSSILSAEAVSLHSIDTFSTTHRSQTFRLRSRR